jgi:hypothetical protein
MAASRSEVHHRVPRCLLGFHDRFATADLDGEGLQAWFEWEEEAPATGWTRTSPAGSSSYRSRSPPRRFPAAAHRSGHSRGDDFACWGRRGGLRALALYGRGWFVLLTCRRWQKITPEQLAESFALLCRGRS